MNQQNLFNSPMRDLERKGKQKPKSRDITNNTRSATFLQDIMTGPDTTEISRKHKNVPTNLRVQRIK